jgi:glycosyltransferase involved in cell wall biosynthesis
MIICFIYREPRQGGYSIEEVFRNVRSHLPENITQVVYRVDGSKSKWWNMKEVCKIDANVYHITGDCNYMGMLLPKRKTILTIHDLGHLEYTLKGVRRLIYKTVWWSVPLWRIRYFTTVSNFTQQKVLDFFRSVKRDRITAIYNPSNLNFIYNPKLTLNPIPQILQIGGGENKNVETLMNASQNLAVKLVFVRPQNMELKNKLISLDIDFEWHSNLSEEELIALYNQIDMVYFASTYEGFGLPIIEAQRVGRPVITSNVCSMPEVIGDSPYIVNPKAIDEVKNAIVQLSDLAVWQKEVARGLQNVKRFDPKIIADQYNKIYQKIT